MITLSVSFWFFVFLHLSDTLFLFNPSMSLLRKTDFDYKGTLYSVRDYRGQEFAANLQKRQSKVNKQYSLQTSDVSL